MTDFLAWTLPAPDLEGALRSVIAAIPRGRVATCGALAELLGDRQAARWIGAWLVDHDHDERCRCHRVVRAGGRLGAYILGRGAQLTRLREEGVVMCGDCVAESHLIGEDELRQLVSGSFDAPLAQLQELQYELQNRVRMEPLGRRPRDCGGVDVSYRGNRAVAVYCRVSWPEGKKLYETIAVERAAFPYVTSYLSFRELPPILEVLKRAGHAGQLADVIAVNGSGVLHPRGLGIASHLGVVIDRPTIGITRTLLCGEVELEGLAPGESRPIRWRGEICGAVLRSCGGHAQPVYLSVGHRIDVEGCLAVVRPLFRRHRLPEPIYWADRISRAVARSFKD